jgi:hypothetical protein
VNIVNCVNLIQAVRDGDRESLNRYEQAAVGGGAGEFCTGQTKLARRGGEVTKRSQVTL